MQRCSINFRSACRTLYQKRCIEPEEACQQRPYQDCNPEVVNSCQRGLHRQNHVIGFISRQLNVDSEAVNADTSMRQPPESGGSR